MRGQVPAWPARTPAGVVSACPGHRSLPPVPAAAGGNEVSSPSSAPRGRRGQGGYRPEPGGPEQAAIAVCWLPLCLPRPGLGRCCGEMLEVGRECWLIPRQPRLERGAAGRGVGDSQLLWSARSGNRSLGAVPGSKRAIGWEQGGQGRKRGEAYSCLHDLKTRASLFLTHTATQPGWDEGRKTQE